MSITKFRASHGGYGIYRVQVLKESVANVWLPGWTFDDGHGSGPPRKVSKRSRTENYFDSWAEAHAFLLADAEDELQEARIALQTAQGRHGNVVGLKEPQ